jgi:cobalt-zinc-cadmium efflux system membrane fusion protein
MKPSVAIVLPFLLAFFFGCTGSRRSDEDDSRSSQDKTLESTKDTVTLDVGVLKSIGLQVEPVRAAQITTSIVVTAVVKPNETRVAQLRPLSRGRVVKVQVRTGDRVRSGQTLLDYDNIEAGELVNEYRSAVAALDQATARTDLSKKSLDRATDLLSVGAIAKAEVERRDADYRNALASIEVAKAEMNKSSEKLRRLGFNNSEFERLPRPSTDSNGLEEISLRAPFSGVITSANVAEGEVIDPTQTLLTVADLSTVWVQGDLYERDLGQVRPGQEVEILTDAYPGRVFAGRLTYVGDFLDSQTRTAKIRCEAPNPASELKVDMFVRVRLHSSGGHRGLVVPESAVQVIDGRSYVFQRRNETTFERMEVALGSKEGNAIEITSGLRDGSMIVTEGSFYLKSAMLKARIGAGEK